MAPHSSGITSDNNCCQGPRGRLHPSESVPTPVASGTSGAHRPKESSSDRAEESMGRKSRAKATRRAERARLVIQATSRPPEAAAQTRPTVFSVPVGASAVSAPPPLPQLLRSGRSTAADQLKRLVERQRELHAEIEDEIRRLLEQGQSWTVVSDAVGISRQGARQRYRHLAPCKPGRRSARTAQRVSGSAEPDSLSSRRE
jgi:hypothetical protein